MTVKPKANNGPASPPNTTNAGTGLNTGDNGFAINDKDVTGFTGPQKYAYDTGAAGNGGSQGPFKKGVNVSAGYTDADGNPLDLKPATKLTLAKFLSAQTMGGGDATQVANTYPIDATTVATVSLVDSKGYPSALENPPDNAANSFTNGDETTWDYPSPQYPAIQPLLKKGLASGNGVGGNDLLPGVTPSTTLTGDAPASPAPQPGHADTSKQIIAPYTSAVLANNRFTGAAAAYAAVPDVSDPGASYNPSFTQQTKLGEWNPSAATVTAGRLASIGSLLGLRATTTLGATSPGADPNGAGEQAAALLPGLAQLGATTIDQHLLQASDILASLTTDEVPSSDVLSIGSQSWGQLNDVNDPYSGTDALGMVTLSLALVVGLTLVIDGLDTLLGLITSQQKQPSHDDTGRYALGQYYANEKSGAKAAAGGIGGAVSALSSLNFGALLGIQPTNYPLNQAMQSGFNAFFGLPQSSGLVGQLLGSLTSSTDSPQFNVVVARAIIRSSVVIGQQLAKIGGNPMNVINAILSMVDTIRSSKVVSAINVWAVLGDAILSVPSTWTDTSAAGGVKISAMDAKPDDIQTAASQNRLQDSLKLAWSSNRSRANLLLPVVLVNTAYQNPGLNSSRDNLIGAVPDSLVNAYWADSSTNRIPSSAAQDFENQLSAEYVPFYFHDVRTNEMLGFHAFLASLTDDFSAAYEKTEGYGRVEPVKVYKSTERRIGMSFYIAATSEGDFQDMWVKINKLVTLVYPQYTQGMQVSNGQYTFTQPFSQLVGASPLIRIRLGDLLHSNFSQFGLARLFGLGNANFTIDGSTSTNTIDQTAQNLLPAALANALANPQQETYFVAPGVYTYINQSSAIAISSQGPQYSQTFTPQDVGIADAFVVQAMSVNGSNPGSLICQVALNDDPNWSAQNSAAIPGIQAVYGSSDLPTQQVIGGTYVIPTSALHPTPTTQNKLTANAYSAASSSDFATNLSTFMSPTGQSANAVAKSFADVGGKGLAGFIETMSFDWYDKVTWDLRQGNTAPKLCKVTLTFSPIHDISPGLDHLGYNRAPVFPIGIQAPRPTPVASGN